MTTAPTLTLGADRTLVRHTGHSTRYLAIGVTAPSVRRDATRAPLRVSFCLDRSGSMSGSKLRLAKEALHAALGHLAPLDRYAVVAFDDHVDVVTPAVAATADAVAVTRTRLATLDAGGSTALCDGWLTACGEIAAAQDLASTQAARCFVLTDGEANVGEVRPEVLAGHARELYLRGVRTVTFGLGEQFNEVLLQDLATAGGGQSYHIEDARQIRDFFTSELGEALDVTAQDARLVVRAPGVRCEPLTTYAIESGAGGEVTVRLGDLVSEQVVPLVVKLTFPDGAIGDALDVTVELHASGLEPVKAEARFTFADHQANDRQPRARAVDFAVAANYAARATRVAVIKNRRGDFEGAVRELRGTARRIRAYAGDDPELLAFVQALEDKARDFAAPMQEMERKREYTTASSHLKGRDVSGRARKA